MKTLTKHSKGRYAVHLLVMLALFLSVGTSRSSHASGTLALNFQHIQLEDQNTLAKRFTTPSVGTRESGTPSNDLVHPGVAPHRIHHASGDASSEDWVSRLLSLKLNGTARLGLKLGRVIGLQLNYALMP